MVLKKTLFLILICGAVSLYFAFSSPVVMAKLADLSGNNQSSLYVFCMDRIYSNIRCNSDKYSKYLNNYNGGLLASTWLRILSVSGNPSTAEIIQIKLQKAVLTDDKPMFLTSYIQAAGSLGLKSSKDALFKIAENEEKFNYPERAFAITTLFYLDGKNYGKDLGREYIVDDVMRNARKAILESEGKCRTPEQMITIDQRYRAPESGG
ncbi:MAG: hypothetical protein AB7D06_17875 [Pedobacter sp.]